jgi:hypothetical protein
MSRPSHSSWLYHSNMQYLVKSANYGTSHMQVSPACHITQLRSKYSPQHSVLKHPCLICDRPSSTPKQNKHTIILLYILIFTSHTADGNINFLQFNLLNFFVNELFCDSIPISLFLFQTFQMAYSKSKFKIDGNNALPCFIPFWIENSSDKCLTLYTDLRFRSKHSQPVEAEARLNNI